MLVPWALGYFHLFVPPSSACGPFIQGHSRSNSVARVPAITQGHSGKKEEELESVFIDYPYLQGRLGNVFQLSTSLTQGSVSKEEWENIY